GGAGGAAALHPLPQPSKQGDQLALAYNSFFGLLEFDPGPETQLTLRFRITPTGRIPEARLALELVLKPGQALETGTGLKTAAGEARIDWSEAELGGCL